VGLDGQGDHEAQEALLQRDLLRLPPPSRTSLEDAQRRGIAPCAREPESGSYIIEDLGRAARTDAAATSEPAVERRAEAEAEGGNGGRRRRRGRGGRSRRTGVPSVGAPSGATPPGADESDEEGEDDEGLAADEAEPAQVSALPREATCVGRAPGALGLTRSSPG